MRSIPKRPARAVLIALTLVGMHGCGYSVRPPYDPGIRTVYVPMFTAITFRRDLNIQLTELVIKEIERRTPFKVVGSPQGADSTLEGVIAYADKNLLVEAPNNLPRHVLVSLLVTVKWTDNREGIEYKPVQPVVFANTMALYPELGETTSLAYQKSMAKLARDIVNAMEQPW